MTNNLGLALEKRRGGVIIGRYQGHLKWEIEKDFLSHRDHNSLSNQCPVQSLKLFKLVVLKFEPFWTSISIGKITFYAHFKQWKIRCIMMLSEKSGRYFKKIFGFWFLEIQCSHLFKQRILHLKYKSRNYQAKYQTKVFF